MTETLKGRSVSEKFSKISGWESAFIYIHPEAARLPLAAFVNMDLAPLHPCRSTRHGGTLKEKGARQANEQAPFAAYCARMVSC